MSQKPLLKRVLKWVIGVPVALLLILFLIGLLAPESTKKKGSRGSIEATASEDIEYAIVKKDEYPNTSKANISVELKGPINEKELRTVGSKVREEVSDSFERVYIAYYLQKSIPNSAYAVTNFEGEELKLVTFNGATKEQIEKLKSASLAEGKLVGNWIEPSFIGQRITIYEKDGKYYLKQLYKDGSIDKVKAEKMIHTKVNDNESEMRFDYQDSQGDYFKMLKNNDLGIFNKEGKQLAIAYKL